MSAVMLVFQSLPDRVRTSHVLQVVNTCACFPHFLNDPTFNCKTDGPPPSLLPYVKVLPV